MNAKQDNFITVLDAGSSKVCVLVAELQDGVLRYRGHGIEPARGMRKGLIAELGPAAEAINRAALTAERVARQGIETTVVGIGGTHVPWTAPAPWRCRRTVRCCTCCRRSSSWTTKQGFTTRSAWWGTSWR
jgi:cell division ATPase FtsA